MMLKLIGGHKMKATARLHKINTSSSEAIKAVSIAIISMLLGAAKIFMTVSPFGVALVAALPIKYCITASVGSIIGIFIFSTPEYRFYYILSILIVTIFRFILAKLTKKRLSHIVASTIAIASMTIGCATINIFSNFNDTQIIFQILEVLLCGSFAYFYSITSHAILYKKSISAISYIEKASIVISFLFIVIALSSIFILQINIGIMFGVIAIYILINSYGIVGASIGSIILSIGFLLASTQMLEFSVIFVLSSFLSAAFSPLKKVGQALIFIVISVFTLFLAGAPAFLTYRIIDVFFATAIYILIPERIINLVNINTPNVSSSSSQTLTQENISAKLKFASGTITDLEQELDVVSKRFNDIDYNNISSIYDVVSSRVCKPCKKSLSCWENEYNDTMDTFNNLNKHLKLKGEITKEDFNQNFIEKCIKINDICTSVNHFYKSFLSKQAKKGQILESRNIVFEQMHSVADMLYEVSQEISDIKGYDETISNSIVTAFKNYEDEFEKVICIIDKFGRTSIEMYTNNIIKSSPLSLLKTVCNATSMIFELPSITTINNKTKISFCEKARYEIDISVQQACCGDNQICGDSVEHFSDAKGNYYIILSDGMGNGKRAAIDSIMTCTMFMKLIKSGFSTNSAIKIINSSLLVKSTDESLSTVDIIKIDLYTGDVEFLKAGATTTFVNNKGSILRINPESLPIGIIQQVNLKSDTAKLIDGDMIAIVSDGATCVSESYISDHLKKNQNSSAKETSIKIMTDAKSKLEVNHPDDITVIVVKLKKYI